MAPRMGAKQAGSKLATTDPPCTLPADLDWEDRVGALSDGRAEALLRSALEKIVYFEAQSEQLQGDATTLRAEADQLRAELGAASSREVELRRRVAELEVEVARAHRERGEAARVVEAMRAERDGMMGKVLEASRIHGAADHGGPDFDLAGFIAELRSEALALRGGGETAVPSPVPTGRTAGWMQPPRSDAPAIPAPGSEVHAVAPVAATRSAPTFAAAPVAAPPPPMVAPAPPKAPEVAATREAERLFQQGRLGLPTVPRFSEESLFGFSVRELSSPDPSARVRTAERLRMLGERAAAPALAVALHAERDPSVLVALLDAFRTLASREGTAVVAPLLEAPDPSVRIAALRAITTLDPDTAATHLARAAHDAEPSVRRRAALLAVTLGPERTLELEREAARDPDPDVRRLVVLAAGAAGGDAAKGRLLASLDDVDLGVRRAAARSLSRLLGLELGHVPELSNDERRREIRRLSTVELPPLASRARLDQPLPEPKAALEKPRPLAPEPVEMDEEPEAAPPPELHSDEALCLQITQELQGAMRGRTVVDLAGQLGVAGERVVEAAALLAARGQVVRRGTKLFVA
jgi:HEAT repeats